NIIRYANDFVDSSCSRQALTDVGQIGLKLGREKLCFAIFEAMRCKGIEIRPHFYWPLLMKVSRNKGETEIYSLLKSMTDAGVEMDSDTLLHYVYPYINTARPIDALQKLQLSNIPKVIMFTPLLSFLLQHNR
ncbi:PREDICTED: leucine-rich PPR motif-containing protein, mitochondrial-like, partial [Wasmannia auropunctata]|uniref:leucine-rich PPR motif-containing protein, mitochondrial-like n=1 Tax=Wasmannia auropunctata TaxID=64793 RepID=UPI0005ED9F22